MTRADDIAVLACLDHRPGPIASWAKAALGSAE